MCAQKFSCLWFFVTPWTVASQAPLSMRLSWQEYCCGFPFPSPGDLPNPGIEPLSLASPALAGRFFTTEPPGKPVVQPQAFIEIPAAAAAAKSRQSCLTLCDPIDGSPTGSSAHGILQAWVLEWGAIAFSDINTYAYLNPLSCILAKEDKES